MFVLGIAAIGGSARDIRNFGGLFDGSHARPPAGWAQLIMMVLSVLFVLTMLMPAGKAKGK